MQLNEPFRDALEVAVNAHKDVLRLLDRFTFDNNNEAQYCKTIGVLIADNIGQMDALRQTFYAMPPNIQHMLIQQSVWRVRAATFLADDNCERGQHIQALSPYVQDAVQKTNYAFKLYSHNPDDFDAFDRAFEQIDNLKVTMDGDNN